MSDSEDAPPGADGTGPAEEVGSVSEEAAKLFGVLAGWSREVGDHVATGAPECTYCPVCRTIHVVRECSPEVRDHLATAAASLMQAAAGVLGAVGQQQAGDAGSAGAPGTEARGAPVEHIDLDPEPGAGPGAGSHGHAAPGDGAGPGGERGADGGFRGE